MPPLNYFLLVFCRRKHCHNNCFLGRVRIGGQITYGGSSCSSCICYCAYRKMTAAKIVFLCIFVGGKGSATAICEGAEKAKRSGTRDGREAIWRGGRTGVITAQMAMIRGHLASQNFWGRQHCSPPRTPTTDATPLGKTQLGDSCPFCAWFICAPHHAPNPGDGTQL